MLTGRIRLGRERGEGSGSQKTYPIANLPFQDGEVPRSIIWDGQNVLMKLLEARELSKVPFMLDESSHELKILRVKKQGAILNGEFRELRIFYL